MATNLNNQISVPVYTERKYIGRKDKYYVFLDFNIDGNLIIAEKKDLDDLTLFSANKNYQRLSKRVNEYRQNVLIQNYFGIKLFSEDDEYSFFEKTESSLLLTLNLIDSMLESTSLNDLEKIFDFLQLTDYEYIKIKENWYKIYEQRNGNNNDN
jgi:hypothetical protein|nr:MAG TPA: hypothetical protein [Caudoviricetes sp.]